MNDLSFDWKTIRKGLPQARHAANDRAPNKISQKLRII